MRLPTMFRVLALALAAAVAATACTASETVVIADGVVESATATALRSDLAQNPAAGAQQEAPTPDATTEAPRTDPSSGSIADSSDSGEDSCSYQGVDSFGDMQVELIFTSPLDTQTDATIGYEVLSGAGDNLVEGSHWMEDLAPGERVRMSVDTVTDEPAGRTGSTGITCTILDIDAVSFGADSFTAQTTDSCTFIELDSYGDIQIRIDVISAADTSTELAIDYALRGPDGIRFEDSVAFTDIVAPGELSSTSVDTFTEFPTWVSESTFRCQILSIQEF